MTVPYSESALAAHYARATAEGGERIVKEYRNFDGYRVAIVHFAGEATLIIRPEPRQPDAWNVAIPRSEIAQYLTIAGSIEPQFFARVPAWLERMGKEVTMANCHRVADIFTHVWPDFFNVMQDRLDLSRADPSAIVTVLDANGKPIHEQSV